ncbi:MAG: hypothetical protein ACLSFT_10720 [Ruminococcus callidus]
MQHFPFWLALAAGLGTACLLGSVSAAAEDFPAVPVATATTQGTWETRGDGSRCYYDADGTPVTGEVTMTAPISVRLHRHPENRLADS